MLVLDWIEGETLERFMERRGPISSGEALHIVEQLVAALDSLHSAGITQISAREALCRWPIRALVQM